MSTDNDRSDLRTLSQDREQAIATAENIAGDTRADWDTSRTAYPDDDRTLACALDIIWGNGFSEDQCGDVDHMGHAARWGRFILRTNTQGFMDVETREGMDDAVSRMEQLAGELDPPEDPETYTFDVRTVSDGFEADFRTEVNVSYTGHGHTEAGAIIEVMRLAGMTPDEDGR